MNKIFVDTSMIIALFDEADDHHAAASSLMETVKKERISLVMSDYVLDEAITSALTRINHKTAVAVGNFILGSAVVHLIWLDEPLKRKAWDYFKKHSDKTYSFTDCTSFVLMKEMKVTKYLSFDEHFKQAGFSPLTA